MIWKEFYIGYLCFKGQRHSHTHHFLSQDIVKVCSRHLPSPIPSLRILLTEIKLAYLFSSYESSPPFYFEIHRFKGRQKARLIQMIHYSRNKAFSHYQAWKPCFFNHSYLYSLLLQISCWYASWRTCSYDKYLCLFLFHIIFRWFVLETNIQIFMHYFSKREVYFLYIYKQETNPTEAIIAPTRAG